MAIYQFYMAAIPRKGIIEYFGEIPNNLEVDFKKRTEKFLNDKIEDEFDYFEFIQHNCWSLVKINSKAIIKEIDQKLDRANWGNDKDTNNWKTETENVDNDAWILTNEEQTQILEFTFRADLRQPKLKFLIEMIELSKLYELLLMDKRGNLIEPEIEPVIESVKNSNSFKFVENPIQFLSDLDEGKFEIE